MFVTAVCGGGASSGMSSARALDDIAAAAANIPVSTLYIYCVCTIFVYMYMFQVYRSAVYYK